jgi:hypothetical protein
MKLAVTDANIFIDLTKLQLLGYLFSIDIQVHTTAEIVDQLNASQQEKIIPFVQANSLLVCNFSSEELTEIVEMDCPRALDIADKTVYYLAEKLEAEVLTGDGPLRRFCATKELTVRGIVWLFDIFLSKGLITHSIAIEKMNELLNFNSRLPKAECMSRLHQWVEKI